MRALLISIVTFLSIVLFFPNLCNRREQNEFSGIRRLEGMNVLTTASDSVLVQISDFYDRGDLVTTLLGKHHRDLWSVPVRLPVFEWKLDSLSFSIKKIGGGQQTTSFRLTDQYGRSFTLRSVSKDQSNALPGWLHKTGIRTLFRDQAASLDPFAAPVVKELSAFAGIASTNPEMYYIPDSEKIPDEFRTELIGRVMLLEIEPDETWIGEKAFDQPAEMLKSDKMLEKLRQGEIKADTTSYAYHRLFDVLIGDWDRHGKQWMWQVDQNKIAHPIPVDRDMAFYKFNDGLINRLALNVNPKFQTFQQSYDNIPGYMVNGGELDSVLLKNISKKQWEAAAVKLTEKLTDTAISISFDAYPEPVGKLKSSEHAEILRTRLKNLNQVWPVFFEMYNSR